MMRITNVIFSDAKRLIGRKFSDPVIQDDIRLWPFKVTAGDNDKPMITIRYKDQDKQLCAEYIFIIVYIFTLKKYPKSLGCDDIEPLLKVSIIRNPDVLIHFGESVLLFIITLLTSKHNICCCA